MIPAEPVQVVRDDAARSRSPVPARLYPPAACGGGSTVAASSLAGVDAGELGCGRGPGRGPDHDVGRGEVEPGLGETGDDADQPRVAGRPAAAEDERSLARRAVAGA